MSDTDGKAYELNGKLIVPWHLDDGRVIHLLTPEELEALPSGTLLLSITGDVDKKEDADLDTRGGRTAYGVLP